MSSLIPTSIHNTYECTAVWASSTLNTQMQFCQLPRHHHSAHFCSNNFYQLCEAGIAGEWGYTCNLWRAQRRWEIFTQATIMWRQQICALSNALWQKTLAYIILVAVSVLWVSIKYPGCRAKVWSLTNKKLPKKLIVSILTSSQWLNWVLQVTLKIIYITTCLNKCSVFFVNLTFKM